MDTYKVQVSEMADEEEPLPKGLPVLVEAEASPDSGRPRPLLYPLPVANRSLDRWQEQLRVPLHTALHHSSREACYDGFFRGHDCSTGESVALREKELC